MSNFTLCPSSQLVTRLKLGGSTDSGVAPTAIAAARASAESKGVKGWRFTLQAPSYLALMTYLDDAPIREQVYRAYAILRGEPYHK